MRQLRNQRLPKQYGFLAGFGQATVRQHARIMYEIRDLIKAVKNQHKRVSLLVKRRQQRCQLRAGLHIQSVKRFIQDQEFRLAHQRLTQQRFARFTG